MDQDAGAFAVELEIIPSEVAAEIANRVDIFIIGMGMALPATPSIYSLTMFWGTTQAIFPDTLRSIQTRVLSSLVSRQGS